MKRLTIVTIVLIAVGSSACGSGAGDTDTASEPLTQAQKDSIVGNLPVPGASGVRGAMAAAEKAKERAEQHDTMR